MKFLAAIASTLVLAASSLAQNLSNPDFETSWTSGSPAGWSNFVPSLTTTRDTSTKSCGTAACRLRTSTAPTSGDFAKQWTTAGSPAISTGDVVMGKFRVRLPPQSFGAGAVYVQATGADSLTGAPVGQQMLTLISPSMAWQEITVYYIVPPIPANGLTIRTGIRYANMPAGINLWVDQVFFQGTSISFGSLVPPVCPEPDFIVASNGLQYWLDAYTGSIKKVLGVVSGTSFMPTVPAILPLFTLEPVYTENPTAPWITNTTYSYCIIRPPLTTPQWTVQTTTNASTIPEASNIRVTVSIQPSSTASDIAFSMTVVDTNTSTTGTFYDEFQCPVIKLPPQLGSSASDDMVFLPGGDGWTDTGADIFSWGSSPHTRDYPGTASMQFEAYFDGTMGLSVEAHDTAGECKQFGWRALHGANDDNVELMVLRRYPQENNRTVQSYPVVVSQVSGGWENVAKHYRTWARAQSWATSQKYQGPAIWVHDRPPMFGAELEVMGNNLYLVDPASAPGWSGVMNDWSAALGTSMMPLFRNFEHYGIFAAPYYATALADLKPSTAIDALCWQGLLANGHHTMAMVAGLRWLRARDLYPYSQNPPCLACDIFWVQGFSGPTCDLGPCGSGTSARGAGCRTNGQVLDDLGNLIDTWDMPFAHVPPPATPPGKDVCVVGPNSTCTASYQPSSFWDGDHSFMCPRCKMSTTGPVKYVASQVLGGLAAKLASNGMQLFELDQMNGGGNPPCYSTNALHDGHPKGYGKWIFEGIVNVMKAVRDVRQSGPHPEFAMSMEDPGELYIPYMDCVIGRPNFINGWVADEMANSRIVPAFQYVYSDLVPTQTTDITIPASKPASLGGGNETLNEKEAIVELSRLYVANGWLAFIIDPWQAYMYWSPPNWTSGWEPISSHANTNLLAFLQHCVAASNATARTYFDTGRMVSSDGFVSPSYTYVEEKWVGGTQTCASGSGYQGFECVSHTVDAVSRSAWQLNNPVSIALVLANVDTSTSSTTVTLPTGFDGLPPPNNSRHVSINGGTPFSWTLPTLVLQPLDVAVVTYN